MTLESQDNNYERDHSHSHCYDTQEGHDKHLVCCICRKDNPHLQDNKTTQTNQKLEDIEWVCEQHPDKPFPHDECSGPGMPHDCFDHLDTAIRKGRAKYVCSVCGEDVSFMWFLYQEAIWLKNDVWKPHKEEYTEGAAAMKGAILKALEKESNKPPFRHSIGFYEVRDIITSLEI